VLWKCVEFAQEAISGLALLELAGVNSGQPPQVYDWGGGAYTVCQIDRQPAQVPDKCFAKMSDPNWSDWYVHNGAWTQRLVGVSGYSVSDGDVEGWTYSSGYGSAPPSVQFNQVCVPPAAASVNPSRPPTQVAVAPSATSNAQAPSSSPSPSERPASQALVPAASSQPKTALAATGPPTQPPKPVPIGPWLLLGVAMIALTGLGAFNLRRRGP
jgi:hypothetical protein